MQLRQPVHSRELPWFKSNGWGNGERVSGVPTRAELGAKVGGIGDRVSGVQHMTGTGMFESEPLT